jgi:hypothetical protein
VRGNKIDGAGEFAPGTADFQNFVDHLGGSGLQHHVHRELRQCRPRAELEKRGQIRSRQPMDCRERASTDTDPHINAYPAGAGHNPTDQAMPSLGKGTPWGGRFQIVVTPGRFVHECWWLKNPAESMVRRSGGNPAGKGGVVWKQAGGVEFTKSLSCFHRHVRRALR